MLRHLPGTNLCTVHGYTCDRAVIYNMLIMHDVFLFPYVPLPYRILSKKPSENTVLLQATQPTWILLSAFSITLVIYTESNLWWGWFGLAYETSAVLLHCFHPTYIVIPDVANSYIISNTEYHNQVLYVTKAPGIVCMIVPKLEKSSLTG